ncbi:MAG: hypothetical protein LBV41_06970 [Cytophagaceae bacterium]|nr:hypothetical protein [Cytophagaceae bacterium]
MLITARGVVDDEQALVQALTSKHIAGTRLDVLANEPHSSIFACDSQCCSTTHEVHRQNEPYDCFNYRRFHCLKMCLYQWFPNGFQDI